MQILIAEDERITRRNLQRQLGTWGHDGVAAAVGAQAWALLQQHDIGLVITDWVMPEVDGVELVRMIRARQDTRYVYVILLTSKVEKNDIVEAMDAGADDFLSKPFDRNELHARLRAGIRVIELEQDLEQRNRELGAAHASMKKDLAAAVDYVMSLIPEPNLEPVMFDWRYIPSSDVGGDTFGYHRINDRQIAMYLVDVTGHGLDSALLSVSIINLLRSGSLPDTDFTDPGAVLYALNERFQGPEQGGKLFTIWYGVIDTGESSLSWAGGGHPDAILIENDAEPPVMLPSTGIMIGVLRGQKFEVMTRPLADSAKIFMYSDGVYEVTQSNGKVWSQHELVDFIEQLDHNEGNVMDNILNHVRKLRGASVLEDDFTIVEALYVAP
jgi:sigma-B regulation protein RsbU (phosphoserine phosphatase)